jgi:hypothetical protein
MNGETVPATEAIISHPADVSLDSAGNLYIAGVLLAMVDGVNGLQLQHVVPRCSTRRSVCVVDTRASVSLPSHAQSDCYTTGVQWHCPILSNVGLS